MSKTNPAEGFSQPDVADEGATDAGNQAASVDRVALLQSDQSGAGTPAAAEDSINFDEEDDIYNNYGATEGDGKKTKPPAEDPYDNYGSTEKKKEGDGKGEKKLEKLPSITIDSTDNWNRLQAEKVQEAAGKKQTEDVSPHYIITKDGRGREAKVIPGPLKPKDGESVRIAIDGSGPPSEGQQRKLDELVKNETARITKGKSEQEVKDAGGVKVENKLPRLRR